MNFTEPNMFFDISPLVGEKTAVFPGDQAFNRKVSMTYDMGDSFELSSVSTTLHVGAHLDSFKHFTKSGKTIDEQEVSRFLGPCQVLDVKKDCVRRILVEDLGGVDIKQKRVLLKTGTFPDPNKWRADFASLSIELIDYLHSKGVMLIGIDTPSVDPSKAKVLEAHQRLFDHQISNLEGIVLDNVTAGDYMLSCLPLKLQSCEASPVRAVLYR